MNDWMKHQRGEGKVGCTISLLAVALLAAVAIKVIPVYYTDNQIYDIVERKAEQGAGRLPEDMEKELRLEIRPLGVPEALAPSAIKIRKIMSGSEGRVVVTLRYTHKVDLYGITDWTFTVDKTLDHPVLEGIK